MPGVEAVSVALHLGELPAGRVDELCEVLFAVAAAGDAVAGRVGPTHTVKPSLKSAREAGLLG